MIEVSEKEFSEFLKTAKKLGVKAIEMGGVLVVLDPENEPKIGVPRPKEEYFCETHQDRDIRESNWKGREGEHYCYDCHLDKKQQEWNSQKTW